MIDIHSKVFGGMSHWECTSQKSQLYELLIDMSLNFLLVVLSNPEGFTGLATTQLLVWLALDRMHIFCINPHFAATWAYFSKCRHFLMTVFVTRSWIPTLGKFLCWDSGGSTSQGSSSASSLSVSFYQCRHLPQGSTLPLPNCTPCVSWTLSSLRGKNIWKSQGRHPCQLTGAEL